MSLLSSKWFISLSIPLLALLLAAVFSKKSVHAEIQIQATPEAVWATLMAPQDFPKWHAALHPQVDHFEEGMAVPYIWNTADGRQIEVTSKVKAMIPNQLLHQGGGTPGIMTFDHFYELTPDGKGTKVVQREDYRGLGIWFWNPAPVGLSYQKSLDNLKTHLTNRN